MNGPQNTRYGPHMGRHRGWIGKLGEEPFLHRFGGQSWGAKAKSGGGNPPPVLLLTLDLSDDRLTSLRSGGSRAQEIPLCGHLNCAELSVQAYQIEAVSRTVQFVTDSPSQTDAGGSLLFPVPLPERRIRLVPMENCHLPVDADTYWQACDSFVGGGSFIRILGPPVWLQHSETEQCRCGRNMDYVASIGYERYDAPAGFLDKAAFFIGEVAMYFFLCKECMRIHVLSQST